MSEPIQITIDGDTRTVSEWADAYGINPKTVWGRLHNGWTAERAVTTPVQHVGRMTKRQLEVWEFIIAYRAKHHISPTIREIRDQFGLSSTNAVSDHLKALHKKGLLRLCEGRSRAWLPLNQDGEVVQ